MIMPLSLKTMESRLKGTSEIRALERCRSTICFRAAVEKHEKLKT